MIKLSIIIPVYNVEKYVGKCLESCLNQDIPKNEYEIIVVNDGTKDNSVQVIEKYITPENNIRLIHRKNGGLSAARNTGLKEAKGEYVWFVDSDDWIESDCLKLLTGFAEDNNLDVLCFGLQLVYPDGRKSAYNIEHEKSGKIYKGEDFICKVKMPPAACTALYRRIFLEKYNIYFYEGILHEDQEFTPRAYFLAKRIAYINKELYNYLQRTGGIMKSSRNKKRSEDLLTVADSLCDFTCRNVEKNCNAYNEMTEKVNFAFMQSLAYYEPTFFPISLYKTRSYYPLRINGCKNLKNLMKYLIANISLKLYLRVYKLL